MKKNNPNYKINISISPDDSIQTNNNSENSHYLNDINNKEKKVKINMDLNNKSVLILNNKKNLKKSILKSKKSCNKMANYLNLETNDNKTNKSNKSIFLLNHFAYPKSSLNVKNKFPNKSFLNEKDKNTLDNKSLLVGSNKNNISLHSRGKLNKTKRNFLNLINPNNINKIHKESNITSLRGKDLLGSLDGDSLGLIEKNLQNKLLDMGKEKEFLEFETNPLEISLHLLNKKKSPKLTSRKSKKEDDKKDFHSLIRHNTMIHKGMLNNLTNNNFNNSNSEERLLGNYDKTSIFQSKFKFSNKKLITNHLHLNNKLNLIKKNNNNNLNKNYYKINLMKSDVNGIHSSINPFLKTHSFKSTIINRSKTASNSQRNSFIDNDNNNLKKDISNAIIEKLKPKTGMVFNNDKFRILTHRKLVYDSMDDEEIIEDAIVDNFFIYPDDKIVLILDSIVLFLTIWSMIYMPLKLVLNNCDIKNTITSFSFDNILNIIIDFFFICDLIINFFKAFFNFDEQLVTRSDKIILNYLKTYFIIDFISAIPYYSIDKSIAYRNHLTLIKPVNCSKYYNHEIIDKYQIIELLKLLKMIKCIGDDNIITNYIVNNLNQISFFETWSFLFKDVFLTFLVLHLTACLHIFISCTTFPNWIIQKNLDTSPFVKVYLSSIYFLITTVTSVGYGDIIGNSFTEIIFQIFLLMVGIIAYSWLISSISNYVKENNSQNEIFNQKLSILNEIKLENPKMKKELFDKIYLHLEYINLKQKRDKSSLIDSLPHSVKKTLLYQMYKPIIESFHFFKNFNNSEFVNRVISKLKPVLAVKNDLLLEQGEIIEDTIFVKQGRLGLEVKIDADNPEKSIEKLLSEEYFFGIENNELYQKSAFGGIINMTAAINNNNQTIINKKNLYNLYSGNNNGNNLDKKGIKPIITTTQGKNEIQKNRNLKINYINLKILDIRKNEHFGALLMFLNKRSPLTLRVKTKKAELYFLKKIDAVEISTSYPNIWKRVNRKSFHNLKEIKKMMKKIIKHFCQTYGIDFDFGTKIINNYNLINTNINHLQKMKTRLENNVKVLNTYNNSNIKLRGQRRKSVGIYDSHLKMLQQFPRQTNIFTTKTNCEKNIEKLIPKNFERNHSLNDNNLVNMIMKIKKLKTKRKATLDKANPMDISLSIIKAKKRNKNLEDNQQEDDNNIRENNTSESDKNTKEKNVHNLNKISFNNTLQKTSEKHLKNNSNKILAKYGEEETNNLMKFFGTPYYPEDINDEVYPGESFDIVSQRNFNTNNAYEQEYFPDNNLLLSYDNNITKTKNNLIESNALNNLKINKSSNNFTINNNFITNNVINNLSTHKYNGNLSITNFNLNILKTNHLNNKNMKINKKENFTIFKQSFEISYNNNNNNKSDHNIHSIDICKSNDDIIKNINKDGSTNIKKKKFKTISKNKNYKIGKLLQDKNKNSKINYNKRKTFLNGKRNSLNIFYRKINNENDSSSSNGSLSCSSFSSISYYNNDENIFICNTPSKKTKSQIKSIKTCVSPKKSNNANKFKFLKINQNIIIKINGYYENLNMVTDGKYCKSKRLQNFIKNILIKKVLKHKKEEENKSHKKEEDIKSPKKVIKSTSLKLVKHKTMAKNIPEQFKNNLYKITLKDDKLKKTDVKSLFKKNMISDINDRNSIIAGKKNNNRFNNTSKISSKSIPKRRKTRIKDDEFLLHYVNRNIRDDNEALNNPGQFYKGVFNNIMKKVTIQNLPNKKK